MNPSAAPLTSNYEQDTVFLHPIWYRADASAEVLRCYSIVVLVLSLWLSSHSQ